MSSVAAYVRIFEASVATVVASFVVTAVSLVIAGFGDLVPLILVIYVGIAMALHVAFFYPRAVSIARVERRYSIAISTPIATLSFDAEDIALSDTRIVGTPLLGIRVGNMALGIFRNLLDGRLVCFAKYSTGILARVSPTLSVFLGTRDLDALVTCLEGGGALCIA